MDATDARRLAREAQSGSISSRNRLTEAHLPACKRMASLWLTHAVRAGLHSVEGESLYSDAYTALLGPIISSYDVGGPIPFRSWLNLQLRGRLTTSINDSARHEKREIPTDIDELCGLPLENDDTELDQLPGLLEMALGDGLITEKECNVLTLIGSGSSFKEAGAVYGVPATTVGDWVKRCAAIIRREVLLIAD